MNNMQFGNPYMTNPYITNSYANRYINTNNNTSQSNGIIWVQGIEGAKAWQLAPNSNILLVDSENDGVFYIKITDNVGMSSLRTFNYVEVTEQPKPSMTDMSKYVTRDELNEIIAKLGGKSNAKSTISTDVSKTKSKSITTE